MTYQLRGKIMETLVSTKIYNIYNMYDGPEIVLRYENDRWIINDGDKILWDNKTYDDIILRYINDTINLERLDINEEYRFIYLSYKNINMVNYFKKFGVRYERLVQISGPKIEEVEEDEPIYRNIGSVECNEIMNEVNNKQKLKKIIFQKGFIIEDIDTGIRVGTYTTMFNKINKMLKNYSNKYEYYLYLYQNNLLNNYISYISNKLYSTNIINRINRCIKCISNEILNIFFLTNNKNNSDIYYQLSDTYKNLLYQLKMDYRKTKVRINIHVIYSKLKSIDLSMLKQLIFDRQELIKNNNLLDHFDKQNYDLIIVSNFLRK